MGGFKKFAGEQTQRYGAESVECPKCGAKPGFYCTKKGGQYTPGFSHKARRDLAGAQARA